MPYRTKNVTKDYLVSVPLPTHGSTYTVISHQSIIDYAYQELANQGFGIVDEEYRCTSDGQIAQGIYKLQFNSDPEMSIMFAWTNSYNKQIKFKCATGAYIHTNKTVMLPGQIGAYARKHMGSADVDTVNSMQSQITNAMMYYNNLVQDKDAMKSITLTVRKQAELLGILFAEYEILNTEQASMIRREMDKPSYFYNGGKHTLWAFYNHVTLALQQAHPRTWMEDQRMLHWIIQSEFDLSTPVSIVSAPAEELSTPVDPLYVVPNQTNILDQIAEAVELDSIPEGLIVPSIALAEEQDAISEQIIIQADAEEDILDQTRELIDALMNAPEIDASEIDMSKVTWVDAPDVVQYTDPVGNTFEAPIVDKPFVDELTEAISEKFETEVDKFAWEVPTLEPTPEEHELFEAELGEAKNEIVNNTESDSFDFDLDLSEDDEDASNSSFDFFT